MGVWRHAPSNPGSVPQYANFVTSAATRRKSWPNGQGSIAIMLAVVERGERNIALENIVKLAKALSVSPRELFAEFP